MFVHVAHCYGSPVEGAEIKLTRNGEDGKLGDIKKFTTHTLEDIPYGKYTLDVSLRGFYLQSREIVIDQPESWFTGGMRLEGIETRNYMPFGGRVLPSDAGNTDTKWVRLDSLFSNLILEAAVERSSGEFSFTKVPHGSYILLTLSNSNLCDMRRVYINGEGPAG